MPVRSSSLAGHASALGVRAGALRCRAHTGQCQWQGASGRQAAGLALHGLKGCCWCRRVARVEKAETTMQHASQRLVGAVVRPAILGCLPEGPGRRCKAFRAGICGACCPSAREASAACQRREQNNDTGGCPACRANAPIQSSPPMAKQRVASSAACSHCSQMSACGRASGHCRGLEEVACWCRRTAPAHVRASRPKSRPTTSQPQASCKGANPAVQ